MERMRSFAIRSDHRDAGLFCAALGIAVGLVLWTTMCRAEPVAPQAAPKPASPFVPPTQVPLDFVTDRTDLSGQADTDAYYGLLDYVRRVDPDALQAAARQVLEEQWKSSEFAAWPLSEFQFYYDLTQRPQSYRGKPITLYGHIRLHHVDHPPNDYGIDPIHIAYLYTDDSQHHPVRVVFTENPDQVPVGEEVTSGISVTGYFMKLYRYQDRDGKGRFMPLVIARSIHWSPPQPLSLPIELQVVLAGVAVGTVGGLVWYLHRTRRADELARQREKHLLGQDQPPDFTALPRDEA